MKSKIHEYQKNNMKNMSKKLVLSLAILATVFTGCSDDNNVDYGPTVPGTGELSGNITSNMTLNAGTVYTLIGATYVKSGVTLTIPAGTRIEADAAGEATAFLAIEKGGTINAQGTAAAPIVFTSNSATPEPGDWGGLVICGNAITNLGANAQAEVTGLTYGGTNSADNSGILSHIVIEYSGNIITGDSEFNGLTFYAVGSGTTVNNILVRFGSDDAIEWFGGSVGGTNLAAIGCQDDSFDWTEGWNGTVSNLYSDQSTAVGASSDSRGLEADNNQGNPTLAPISNPTISNITLLGRNSNTVPKEAGMWLRRGTKATITNAYIANYKSTDTGSGYGINFDGTDSQTFFTLNPLSNITISNVTTASNLPVGYNASNSATGAGSGAAIPSWMSWMGL
jgi:hypothetical protein